MKNLLTIALTLITMSIFAQDGMQVMLEPSSDSKCLSITLTSITPEDLHLKGQNYRFFYDDSKLNFEGAEVNAELADNNFNTEIALHRDGLSKEINGNIGFEANMGFVSMNVMPENLFLDHVSMSFWQKVNVADVCFAQEVNVEDVIIAREKVTSEYSRAYCVFDWEAADQVEFATDGDFISEEDID